MPTAVAAMVIPKFDGLAARRLTAVLMMLGMIVGGSAHELVSQVQSQQTEQTTAAPVPPATSTSSAPVAAARAKNLSYDLDVSGGQQWTDTGIDVRPGERIAITAAGTIHNAQFGIFDPGGAPRTWRALLLALPVHTAPPGALVGRIGNEATAVPFLVGPQKEVNASSAGRLYLGINQNVNDTSEGIFHAKILIAPATATKIAAPAVLNIDPDFLEQVPRRVTDSKGNLGDVVNFVILGSQERVQQAFRDAGWVLVDRAVEDAMLHAVLSSLENQSYVEMPMSELYLFGRPQDFGYARAEPISVVATRHHLRLWRAPFDLNDEAVWIGAATHDIGFEKDQRTGGVTHRVAPEIDQERDFVAACFREAGRLSAFSYLTPSNPVHEARTATGGALHTDGRLLVMTIGPGALGPAHKVITSPDER